MKQELVYYPNLVAGKPGYASRIREIFKEYHQKQGMRMTPQRSWILDYLLKARHHVGMEEINKALKPRGVGKVTVFRALKMLEECHLVSKVSSPNGKPKYEVNFERPHHDHLICIECGVIREIQWPQVEKIQEKSCRALGFLPTFHRHEVYGRCRSCQAEN